jgi:hypothetical protein
VGYVFPPGGKAGTTVNVQLGGYDWTPDMQFFVSDPRVKLDVLGSPGDLLIPSPPYWFGAKGRIAARLLPREVPAKLTIPADAPPGRIYWRAANANGGTAAGVFIVGNGPEVVKDERAKTPQPLASLPATISGRIGKIEEVDRYRFTTHKAGPVTCDLMARRLGADFHGVLEVRDKEGKLIADAADTEGRDIALTFAASAGAEYVVSVRDIDFAGDRSFVYRLAITPGPRVVGAIPAAGKRGETREVEFVGYGVATGAVKLESVKQRVTFPADAKSRSFDYRLETKFGTAPAYTLLVTDLPEAVGTDSTAKDSPRLQVPAAVTGILDQSGAEARYLCAGKKGAVWRIALEARRIGSPLDVALSILGPDGKELAQNDDLPGTTDAGLEFTVPVDGTYQIVGRDLAGKSGTRAAIYRLVVQPATPDFTLHTLQRLSVPIGGKADLKVTAVRLGGFNGSITLTVAGLPTGVSVPPNLIIAADKTELVIPLTSAKDAPSTATLATVTGTATIAGTAVTRPVLAPAATSLAPRSQDEDQLATILIVSTMTPRCKGSPVDKDTGRKVHRGATFPAEVTVQRLDGFQGEIVLRMAARQSYQVQGITGGDVVVPPNVTRTIYPCFMPEWLETTRTSRMAMIAVVKVPDPRGTVRHLVVEIEGMITMTIEGALLKLSHEARDLTVRPGETFAVPVKIARSDKLAEPVRLELRLPEELAGKLKAEAVVVAVKQSEAVFRVTSDAGLKGVHTFTIRATAMQSGKYPVVSETMVEVEFVKKAPR